MSRTKKAFKGLVTSYMSFVVVTAVQLYLSPVLLAKYGQATLGAYASVIQLIGYLTLLDAALSITLNRYIAQAFGKPDKELVLQKILTISFLIYGFLAVLNLFLLTGAAFFVAPLFHVEGALAKDLEIALLIIAVTGLIKTPLSIYGSFLYAGQHMAYLNIVATALAILRGALIILFIHLGWGITGIVVGNSISEIALVFVSYVYHRIKYPGQRPSLNGFDKIMMREVVVFSKDSLIIQLTTKLRMSTDTLLVGIFISVSTASIFYSSTTPPFMCFTLANLLMINTLPGMNEIIGGGDLVKIKSIYFKLLKYVLALAACALIGIILFNRLVVTFWVGKAQYVGNDLNLLVAMTIALLIIGSFNGNFLIAMGIINQVAKAALIVAIAGVALSIVLISKYGMAGLMSSTLAVLIPGNIYSHYQVARILNLNLLLQPKYITS